MKGWETPYIPASLEPLTDSCWHITLPRLRTTNTRLHVCFWATPTEKTNSLIHRRTENKQNLSLWELMQSDQNRTLMWAFVFSSAPLLSVRQSEYCISVCLCVCVCSCVCACLKSACVCLHVSTIDSEKSDWRERKTNERQREMHDGKVDIAAWQRAVSPAITPTSPTSMLQCHFEKRKKTWTHTLSLLLLRFELQIGFKKWTGACSKHINVRWLCSEWVKLEQKTN